MRITWRKSQTRIRQPQRATAAGLGARSSPVFFLSEEIFIDLITTLNMTWRSIAKLASTRLFIRHQLLQLVAGKRLVYKVWLVG